MYSDGTAGLDRDNAGISIDHDRVIAVWNSVDLRR
jgi:hypothetical protein